MRAIVKIPAGHSGGKSSRVLFEKVGLPGYFTAAMEIPQSAFDLKVANEDYSLFLTNEKKIDEGTNIDLLPPSIEQVLWAVGFAGAELMDVISANKPTRFMHTPFEIPRASLSSADQLRQICVRRFEVGYLLYTVCSTYPTDGFTLAYLMT